MLLNLVVPEEPKVIRESAVIKGPWKKRAAIRRLIKHQEKKSSMKALPQEPARQEPPKPVKRRAPAQCISSLFSSNEALQPVPKQTAFDKPVISFPNSKWKRVHPLLNYTLNRMQHESPTPIQQLCLEEFSTDVNGLSPTLLAHDLLVQAPTGSGKSLSYMVPICSQLASMTDYSTGDYGSGMNRSLGTYVIVLTPTRELTTQLVDVLTKLLSFPTSLDGTPVNHWMVPGTLLSGINRSKEKARLKAGVTVLCSTPGRLLDHLQNTANFNFSRLSYVVIEEYDKFLENGALQDTARTLLEGLDRMVGRRYQIVGVSASGEVVEAIAGKSLTSPKLISQTSLITHLDQSYVVLPTKLRLVTLLQYLKLSSHKKIILFVSTCDSVDFLYFLLQNLDGNKSYDEASNSTECAYLDACVYRLHGKRDPSHRSEAISPYRKATTSESTRHILIATNVAARGLDFPDVSLTLQYDPPFDAAEYLHKAGRASRYGSKTKDNMSLLFLLPPEEKPMTNHLSAFGDIRWAQLDPETLYGDKDILEKFAVSLEDKVLSNPALQHLSKQAYLASIRAYATYPSVLRYQGMNPKHLHLGHWAKTFGLRQVPTELGKHSNAPPPSTDSGQRKKPRLDGPDDRRKRTTGAPDDRRKRAADVSSDRQKRPVEASGDRQKRTDAPGDRRKKADEGRDSYFPKGNASVPKKRVSFANVNEFAAC